VSLNAYAGFLKNFALGGLLKGFSNFDTAAGEGPVAFGRRLAPLDQQNASILKNDGADSHPRSIRI
jgi:hypothetical protein